MKSFFFPIIALSLLWTSSSASSNERQYLLNLDCGIYEVQGVLGITESQHFILSVNKGSYSPIEFLVVGGGIEQKLRHLNLPVVARIYLPHHIQGSGGENIVFLQSIKKQENSLSQGIQSLRKESCQLHDKYKN